MKTMKTMLAFVAGTLALSACNNDNDILNENPSTGSGQAGAKFVTLTAYQEGEGASRAAIDATEKTQIDWTENDKINYFGAGSNEYMTLSGGEGSAAGTFSGEVTTSDNDYVLYPYNAEATCTSGTITTTIPSAQSVPAGTFDPAAGLMVGKVNAESVQFYNAVGYIAITIPAGSSNITKMVITGNNNERLSGKVTISNIATDAAPTIKGTTRTITNAASPTGVTDGVKYVEVTPNGTTTFTAGSTYYVAVAPDATLSRGIYVLLYDGAKSAPASLKLAVKKSNLPLFMARAMVKKVALKTIADGDWKGMIALSGCYMAPFNLGATKSTNEDGVDAWGNYYSFGEVDTKSSYTTSAYTGTTALTGLTDAATSNWGPDWRMATSTEWSNNASKSSVKGLPLAGNYYDTSHKNSGSGYYWSSTPNDIYAYDLLINSGMRWDGRFYGFPVRPVLAQ